MYTYNVLTNVFNILYHEYKGQILEWGKQGLLAIPDFYRASVAWFSW